MNYLAQAGRGRPAQQHRAAHPYRHRGNFGGAGEVCGPTAAASPVCQPGEMHRLRPCAEKCPRSAPDEFNQGLGRRKAAYVLYPQAVPLKYAIDPQTCIYFKRGTCKACEKFCPTGAMDFSQAGCPPGDAGGRSHPGHGSTAFPTRPLPALSLRLFYQCRHQPGV